MYVVTVTFEVVPEDLVEFRQLMAQQAANSLEKESGCRHFDVCYGTDQSNLCFLYEKYDDLPAFETHVASDHFREFDKLVTPFVLSKKVGTWSED